MVLHLLDLEDLLEEVLEAPRQDTSVGVLRNFTELHVDIWFVTILLQEAIGSMS